MNRHWTTTAAVAAFVLMGAACSDDADEAQSTTTTGPSAIVIATTAPPATQPPATTEAPIELSACEQFFVGMDGLAGEFVGLVDDGNRSLLLTIGLETPYDVGADELDQIATRLAEISAELTALGEPPASLEPRHRLLIEAVDQFAIGYRSGADAAAISDVVGLNQSLIGVSQGTGRLQLASETLATCP